MCNFMRVFEAILEINVCRFQSAQAYSIVNVMPWSKNDDLMFDFINQFFKYLNF